MKYLLCFVLLFCLCTLSALADIQVTYDGLNAEQEAAFEYAVSLWEPLLSSPVPIKINARMQNVPGFVVVFVPNLIRNFTGAPQADIWYCNALANSLTGTELNPGEADMDFIINPSPDHSWYYGMDGNCPPNSYEFVSEIFKAVPYGLGYMPSFYISSGMGTYGMLNPSVLGLSTSFVWEDMQGSPVLYDTHVCDANGDYLTDTAIYTSPSAALAQVLSGGSLYYNGTYGNAWGGGTQPVLYASTYNLARTARLFSTVYNGTENAAGVPTGVLGTSFRTPSPIVMGILKDQGWDLELDTLMPPPQNLIANISNGVVYLFWEAPITDYDVHEYILLRDGVEIANTTELSFVDVNLPLGLYFYSVKTVYSMGLSIPSNEIEVLICTSNADQYSIPSPSLVVQTNPNPFRFDTQIKVELKHSSPLHLVIYDLRGRKVAELQKEHLNAGSHSFSWADVSIGKELSSGMYLIRCHSGKEIVQAKVLYIK